MRRWTGISAGVFVLWLAARAPAQIEGAAGRDALGVPALAASPGDRGGQVDCLAGYLAGQDQGTCGGAQWYFYSDLMYCNPAPTTCKRVHCENFPDAAHTITKPIGIISWTGIYVADPVPDGCNKPEHLFRVRFYSGTAPDPNNPVASEEHDALATDMGSVLLAGGSVPATVWRFTFVLDNPVNLTTGWFSVCGDGAAGCYHMWKGSGQGDNSIYEWYETSVGNTYAHKVDACDLNYCLSEKRLGACCDECAQTCMDNVSDVYCAGIGGRWVQNTPCSAISPPCGQAMGACCHDDGTCEQKTCFDCEPHQFCVGDINCDGTVDFGDINCFVICMTSFDPWLCEMCMKDCPPENLDINCDGVYGQASFGDINPFVHLMTLCGGGCPCPGPGCQGAPRSQGDYWAGPLTTCDPWPVGGCCTVVIDPNTPGGLHLENEPNNCAPDVYNGGCNITPALFTLIQNGWTIYGQSGTFKSGGTSYRDTDWYQATINSSASFTVTVEAEFDVMIWAARQGPNGPNDPCTGYRDVATPVTPAPGEHNLCTPVVLTTRCLPAGTYWFIVAPASFSGVACGADYKITLQVGPTCEVQNHCADCPGGATYVEGTAAGNPGYCIDDPNEADPNGGCNVTPHAFEALPHNPDLTVDTFTFCGKLWASGGYRDTDWWSLDLPLRSQVQWSVVTEVPCRASLLFNPSIDPSPPSCGGSNSFWPDTLYDACTPGQWSSSVYYEPTTPDTPYFFLVAPEDATGALLYGYPCPMGSVDLGNDYRITMTVTGVRCENEILAKTVGFTEAEPVDCGNPLAYDDTYNSGCDHYPVGPTLPLSFDVGNAWRAQSFAVPDDPNTPLKADYDWYQFTLQANRRFKVYLYADFPASWEIWSANQCSAGPIEGVEVPACNDAGVYTRRCYGMGTYWLRVYPTDLTTCGSYYYLALTDAGSCSMCSFSPSGANLDDPCDDVTDFDTNAGCDDPNAPPPHFMPFVAPNTYWGRIYAGLVNGVPYYDPDWFTITNTYTNSRRLKLTVTAEFLAHVEVYLGCADYNSENPIAGLDGITPLVVGTACPSAVLTQTTGSAPGTLYYGRITCVDQFGNLLTKYYPCAKGNNRWKVATACIV